MLTSARPSVRLAAGTLALALPLAAAAGCGVEKKRTVTQEFQSASTNLAKSQAASFTLRFTDPKGTLKKEITSGDDPTRPAVVDDALAGSIELDIDPSSSSTLSSLRQQQGTLSADQVKQQLKKVNFAVAVRTGSTVIGELRVVAGVLYAHVDLTEVGSLAKDGGTDDFDQQLDDTLDSADPRYAQALRDVRAGKWLTLDLSASISKFEDLAKAFTTGAVPTPKPSATPYDVAGLEKKLYAAIKPSVKVTAANDDPDHRVLNVDVQARSALTAALAVVRAEKSLPFASLLKDVMPSDIDDNVLEGTGHGTITLERGHLTQVSLDLDSIRKLVNSDGAKKPDISGSTVELDVDDSAGQVVVPPAADVSTFDVGALLDSFLKGIQDSASGAATDSSGSVAG